MALAHQHQEQSQVANKAHRLIRSQLPPVKQPGQLSLALAKRLWWHTKGYGTVLGVMLLVLGSLVFLNLHWLGRQLLQASTDESAAEDASWTP
uniref:hypothetical protein n=1 Tax=Trichocoleus desertorum TaxID=1481672 RepID=UPI0025B2C3F2|nr:hypothetical protein [Trichocoleus desertorum]